MQGSTQVSTVTSEGQNYVGTAVRRHHSQLVPRSDGALLGQRQGDLWYFPAGQPHSLQATADDPAGTEFLLVFDTGSFDEDTTFLVRRPSGLKHAVL